MIEDQFLQQSRSQGFINNTFEMHRTDSTILKEDNVMSILSSNTALQEELKKLNGKLNQIVNNNGTATTQSLSLINSQCLSPSRDFQTANDLDKPFRAFLAVLKELQSKSMYNKPSIKSLVISEIFSHIQFPIQVLEEMLERHGYEGVLRFIL